MIDNIISFDSWLSTPLGQYLLRWEKLCMDKAVEDIFGYNAAQLGLPALQALEFNRIPNRWQVCEAAYSIGASTQPDLVSKFDALPLPDQSMDLIVLPHTLDLAKDPHATLREVERTLVPEGKVVIAGLNPASLWGMRQRRTRFFQRFGAHGVFLPLDSGAMIGYWRLRDWLRLLGLEVIAGSFGCYRPPFKTQKWLDRAAWMEPAGDRWWPILGAAYQITAVKRVRGMHLISPDWKRKKAKAQAVTIATQDASSRTTGAISQNKSK